MSKFRGENFKFTDASETVKFMNVSPSKVSRYIVYYILLDKCISQSTYYNSILFVIVNAHVDIPS